MGQPHRAPQLSTCPPSGRLRLYLLSHPTCFQSARLSSTASKGHQIDKPCFGRRGAVLVPPATPLLGLLSGPSTYSEPAAWPPCPDCLPGPPASCLPGGGLQILIFLFQMKKRRFKEKGLSTGEAACQGAPPTRRPPPPPPRPGNYLSGCILQARGGLIGKPRVTLGHMGESSRRGSKV